MSKYKCHYCECESSPRNLLQILTLPGLETVINACALCVVAEYPLDKAARQMVLTAEVMLAAAVGDEAAITARLGHQRVSSTASLFLL